MLLLLVGCSPKTRTIIKPEPVEVATIIYRCPAPEEYIRQPLYIENLTKDSTDDETAKAYKATILQQESTIKELLDRLNSYKHLSDEKVVDTENNNRE